MNVSDIADEISVCEITIVIIEKNGNNDPQDFFKNTKCELWMEMNCVCV